MPVAAVRFCTIESAPRIWDRTLNFGFAVLSKKVVRDWGAALRESSEHSSPHSHAGRSVIRGKAGKKFYDARAASFETCVTPSALNSFSKHHRATSLPVANQTPSCCFIC